MRARSQESIRLTSLHQSLVRRMLIPGIADGESMCQESSYEAHQDFQHLLQTFAPHRLLALEAAVLRLLSLKAASKHTVVRRMESRCPCQRFHHSSNQRPVIDSRRFAGDNKRKSTPAEPGIVGLECCRPLVSRNKRTKPTAASSPWNLLDAAK